MEIKDVFGAQPKSVWEYLCENGQGLYVPAYQRQYSWDKTKIRRLFEDICHGSNMLIGHDDSITFLGTIITVHDTQYLTVNPLVKPDVPARVMTIIDGQQRLTTLIVLNTVLHDEIRTRASTFTNKDDESSVWLRQECLKVCGRLIKTFEEDKDFGDAAFRWYPRMIRAYDDSWSRSAEKAKYSSPIAYYLHGYGRHARSDSSKAFKFDLPKDTEDTTTYKVLSESRAELQKLLREVGDGGAQTIEFPTISEITGSLTFQELIFKSELPDLIRETLLSEDAGDFKTLLRLVVLANFVLDRVALTIVTAKNEDYAFDMFEALNTTGEPLTAFETFKPRVIQSEGLKAYEPSETRGYMQAIEGYLESFGKSEDKQDATSRLIISFALAERGEKLSKRLSDQRRFFNKENFDQLSNSLARKEFVKYLSHATLFIQHAWPEGAKKIPLIYSADEACTDVVILCIDLLRKLKHTITLGVLVRFYSEIRKASQDSRPEAITQFIEAVKAVTAFSVLWRATRLGTENIDSHYRQLMMHGHPNSGMSPLARRDIAGNETLLPLASQLKEAFKQILSEKGGVGNKELWVKEASRLPAYKNQKEIARFLLLAATHDCIDDPLAPGLTKAGTPGILDMLNYSRWSDESSQSVEHIAPQAMPAGWSTDLYDDKTQIDRIGNLTLLPQSTNSSIGNGSWARKKLIYKTLSAQSSDELDPLIKQAAEQGIVISESTAELLANSRYLPMVKAITQVEGEWTLDLIDRRSVRILELAWARIAPWLDLV